MPAESAADRLSAPPDASRRDALLRAECRDPFGHLLHAVVAMGALLLAPLGIVPAEAGFWMLVAVSALRSWTLVPAWTDVLRWPCARWLIALAALAALSLLWSTDPSLGAARLKFLRMALWAFLLWPVLGDAWARPRLLAALMLGIGVLALTQIASAFLPALGGQPQPAGGAGGLHGDAAKSAMWCAAGTCVGTGIMAYAHCTRAIRWGAAALTALAAAGIVVAGSLRILGATCLALALCALLLAMTSSSDRRRWPLTAVATAAVLAAGTWLLAPGLPARAISEIRSLTTGATDPSAAARRPTDAQLRELWWKAELSALAARPVLGWGWGSTPTIVSSSRAGEAFLAAHPALGDEGPGLMRPSHPHSLYLMTLGELGLVGAILLVGAAGSAVRSAVAAAQAHPMHAGMCAALVMWLIAAAGDSVTNSNAMALGTVMVTLVMGAQPVPRRSRSELSEEAGGRLRVAVFVEKFGMPGGSERFSQETVTRLADSGRFEFHVFANRWNCERTDIAFYRVPRIRFPRPLRPWLFVRVAQRMIERGQFDVIHSHHAFPGADVVSVHGTTRRFWVQELQGRRPGLFDRVSDSVDRSMVRHGKGTTFMPVSSLVLATYRRSFGDLPGRWPIVHPGVDAARFASTPERRHAARQMLGLAPEDLALLFVGMNFEAKGLQRIIEALAIAAPRMTPLRVRLLVVGKGDAERYADLSRGLGIGDRVSFMGVQDAGLERYYHAADALLMLSAYETFCMAVLEAMAAGLPVVITDRMGVCDLVKDGEHGHVVAVGATAACVADRIVSLGDPAERARMGEAGRRTAAMHDWSAVAAVLAQEYERIARRARA